MSLLGIDLGGTKLALAIISSEGRILARDVAGLHGRRGPDVGRLITAKVAEILGRSEAEGLKVESVGISVPGISHSSTGTVWAPNIEGWDDYPLLREVQAICGGIPVTIDSDRACYILGEIWQGNARGCKDAVYLSVGTGIGAGILINGEILRGSHDIAGCIGWMALQRPYDSEYSGCGCFEYHASGEGIPKVARRLLEEDPGYNGNLRAVPPGSLKASDVFSAWEKGDILARRVIESCVGFWGMAVANLVSLFNPEKIIFGGGVFGPGEVLIPSIMTEASRWAQPVGMKQVTLEISALGGDAGVYGAGYLALRKIREQDKNQQYDI